ncbi:MAG TPA: DUF362 domain-containing protein [archaeon]|nr:DUF362 domain-containing protein [archaeon]
MSDLSKSGSITRKEFIKKGTLGAVGLGFGIPGAARLSGEEASKDTVGVKVVLAREQAAMKNEALQDRKVLSELLEKALCAYTGEKNAVDALKHFVKPEDTVGVKMSVMMTATNPELVAALTAFLIALGVKQEKIIVWDRDNAGIGLEGAYTREKHYGYDSEAVSRIITDEATALINIPGLKSHWLSGVGGALKNWCGAVTRINVRDIDTPYPFHKDSCADLGMLGAIKPIREKQRLVIIDALRPLFEGGPQMNPAYLWNYGGLFVSQDPVAVDAVCAELLTKKRGLFKGSPWPLNPPAKHVTLADTRYGLGVSDRSKIELIKVGEQKDCLI